MLVKHIARQGLLLNKVGVISRAAYHGTGIKVTMNDLPVPQGDWKENHSRRNAKYNAILITGIVALVSTIGLVKSTGVIALNSTPPTSLD